MGNARTYDFSWEVLMIFGLEIGILSCLNEYIKSCKYIKSR